MKQLGVVCLVVIALAGTAAAQAPAPIEPATAALLEKRIPEELATEGVVLSQRNLGLQIEQLADRWLVSLVDLSTGRIAASTKVDALPVDREAAVAAMTHVVAELASQIVNHGDPPPPPPPAVDDRAERAAHEVAELAFKRQSIRFGRTYEDIATGENNSWSVYQGELDQVLAPIDFYNEVGRPDLASRYRTRRGFAIGGMVVGGVVTAVGFGILAASFPSGPNCPVGESASGFQACLDAYDHDFHQQLEIATTIAVAGMVIGGAGLWVHYRPHPISENEAKTLADGYNQRLRGQLGLPVVSQRPPLIQQISLVPYATGSGAGLSLTGRF